MSRRLVLVKSVVQHTFVFIDDDGAEEKQTEPVIVAGKDWHTYATTTFPESMAALRASMEATD